MAIATVFVLTGEPAHAIGNTYYVSTSGDDSAPGTVTADYDALFTADGDRFLKWDITRY